MTALHYQIALTLIPGIGHIAAKKLIAYCGGAEGVFKEKRAALTKIPGIGTVAAKSILGAKSLDRAEEEIRFIEKNNINAHFYLDKSYPQRLLHCPDGPILLFTKGSLDLNQEKVLSFVGTRNATVKGKAICERLIEEIAPHEPIIVSGLAYGIDITAHKAALKFGLKTAAVLASGLDDVYPKIHAKTANQLQESGAIVSDYLSKTKLHPTNFAERNRIVAGLADAVIVVESSAKGGSLITAGLANGYNRDVFAVPGRVDDSQSVGCNRLIKTNKAALIESGKDLEYILGWEQNRKPKNPQAQLFIELSNEEQLILDSFGNEESLALDEISLNASLPMSKTASILLSMEFKGIINSLPGKVYQRN